ncbi:MAG: hypothetical protein U0231_04115 [Nitrospiraceae bacterium]
MQGNPDHRLTPGLPADAVIRWREDVAWVKAEGLGRWMRGGGQNNFGLEVNGICDMNGNRGLSEDQSSGGQSLSASQDIVVRVSQLVKRYRKQQAAVSGVDLVARRGEMYESSGRMGREKAASMKHRRCIDV